jgi:predicted RNase H-like nuclease
MRAVGVDGCLAGWLAFVLENGRSSAAGTFSSLADVVEEFAGAEAIGVDIPIGLPEAGPRRADLEARRLIGTRRSSVFPAPPRSALSWTRRERGSLQSWSLLPRIREANEIDDPKVFEVHPEVSFRAMTDAGLPPKRKREGFELRRALLAGAGIGLPSSKPRGADWHDVLDGAAAAWSARRKADGTARSVPDPPEQLDGRAVAIWY